MNIHNKIEIIHQNKTYVGFNSMLSPLISAISQFDEWNRYFVFGTGGAPTQPEQTKLNSFDFSEESETVFQQLNPKNGQCYVKKQVMFDEYDDRQIEFCEVGIAASGQDDPECMSRFLITDDFGNATNIVRAAGEQMTVSVTVYLEVDEISNAALIGGDNLLVKTLLGVTGIEGEAAKFKIAVGEDSTPNSEIITRDELVGHGESADLVIINEGDRLVFKIDLYLGRGRFIELVLLLGDQPVLRFNTVEDNMVLGYRETVMSDRDGWAYLGHGNVLRIFNVYAPAISTYFLDFRTDKYGLSFGSVKENPFDYEYTLETHRVVSTQGDKIAFFYADRIDVYKIENQLISRLDTSDVVLPHGFVKMCMYQDYMLILSTINNQSVFHGYYLNGNKYTAVNIDMGDHFLHAKSTPAIKDFALTIMNGNQILRVGFLNDVELCYFAYFDLIIQPNKDLVWEFVFYSNEVGYQVMAGQAPTNRMDGLVLGIRPLAYVIGYIRYSNNRASAIYSSASVGGKFFTSPVFPLFSGERGMYMYTNESRTIAVLDLGFREAVEVHAPEYCLNIYTGPNIRYFARLYEDRVEFDYFSMNNQIVPFEKPMPMHYNNSVIRDIVILDGVVLVFSDAGIYTVDITENHRFVHIPNNFEVELIITYSYGSPLGDDGEPVSVGFDIEVK